MVNAENAGLYALPIGQLTEVDAKIGKLIGDNLVENGATLQMGIGSIPDATLDSLKSHKNLGIHTEMLSDGVLPLIQSGVVTNAQKSVKAGKIVCSFAFGSRKLYDFMDDNPSICKFGSIRPSHLFSHGRDELGERSVHDLSKPKSSRYQFGDRGRLDRADLFRFGRRTHHFRLWRPGGLSPRRQSRTGREGQGHHRSTFCCWKGEGVENCANASKGGLLALKLRF